MSRCYSRSGSPESKALLRVAETIFHIERNYTEPIHLPELVAMSGMSRRSYLRTFEAAMGCPPITYLIRLRIRHAKEMLRREDRAITDAAFAVGFNDSNYFSRQFKLVAGCTPMEYRNQYRIGDEMPTPMPHGNRRGRSEPLRIAGRFGESRKQGSY